VREADVVIVGSGIAGSALAVVLAAAGIRVLVLERQPEYRDHVRGEILWPWGVASALGVERVLLDAGAQVVPRLDIYDEASSDPLRLEVDQAVSGIDGSLNITHPRACSALADAAVYVGADVHKGVRDVRLETGARQRDVHDVSQALLSAELSQADLAEYAERRAFRKRLADLGTLLEVWTNEGCVVQDPEDRAARNEFIEGDEVLTALQLCFMTGFDSLPQDLTKAILTDRLAAYG
jgi:flavin-dependent dehydrogenase